MHHFIAERLARRRVLLSLVLSVTATWVQAAPASKPVTPAQGYAVVIGGALKADNEEVWNKVVALAGGKGSHWVVLATASEAPDKTGRRLADLLERQGAVVDVLPVAPALKWVDLDKAVRDKSLLEVVNNADGIFFSGGAQERIVDTFAPGGRSTPMLEAIWDVYRRGGVVAGTSAGAAIMSAVMFRDAPSVINVMKGQLHDGKEVDRGLGFVGSNLFVDQHFLKRGRFGRMIPLMLAKGYKLGLGVDENSAAIVHGDDIDVIGAKGALLVDLNDVETDAKVNALNVTGARLTYLDRGDSYNLGNRRATPSEWKQRGQLLDPNAKGYKPDFNTPLYYTDMLGDTALVNAMGYLIDSSQHEVRGLTFDPLASPNDKRADLAFQFRLYKGKDSVGWYSDEMGGEDYSVMNLYLDIVPVRMARPLTTPWTSR
ncbi:cyanophycinase [Ideonella sp. B7]|uniref:cyanophycinase n=1 Tax=Ideonella benzenivorans TaxID=2831643 RepID=UPI001CEDE4EC|nr:cyanophycinase [Ideonella benzenivorans]MCA6215487.1 cyanophycinase [Ideonella benzenivorans]